MGIDWRFSAISILSWAFEVCVFAVKLKKLLQGHFHYKKYQSLGYRPINITAINQINLIVNENITLMITLKLTKKTPKCRGLNFQVFKAIDYFNSANFALHSNWEDRICKHSLISGPGKWRCTRQESLGGTLPNI